MALLAGNAALAEEGWISLFNGKNLDGWRVKIAGHELGENPGDIFRVEDGLLTVSYDQFEEFGGRFGHIFAEKPYSNYRFRCEYRFRGEQSPGGPGWALRNSGIMIHCQDPESMSVDQSFPNCVEFQFLGKNETGKERVTGALFTPGSKVDYEGKPTIKGSMKSNCPALPPGEWVKAEAVVDGKTIQHHINGKLVLEYTNPRYDDDTPMTSGHISLQAESHPIQFRNIEILPL
jgi:hypothetical protein